MQYYLRMHSSHTSTGQHRHGLLYKASVLKKERKGEKDPECEGDANAQERSKPHTTELESPSLTNSGIMGMLRDPVAVL